MLQNGITGRRTRRTLLALVIASFTLSAGSMQTLAQIGTTFNAAAQTEQALKSLSPAAQAVMDRLNRLGTIPLDNLRYHAGALPNGPSPELNDDAWQAIEIPFKASEDEVWLRKQIVIPPTLDGYDPSGVRVWLQEPT